MQADTDESTPLTPDSGITIRDADPVDAAVVIRDTEWTVSKLHCQLFTNGRLGEMLLHAVRDLAAGQTIREFIETLEDAGVDALQPDIDHVSATEDGTGFYADLCLNVARGNKRAAWELLRATRQLGAGQTSLDIRSSRADIYGGALAVFAVSDMTPRIGVRLDESFRAARRDHREQVLELIRALAEGCAVDLVVGPIGQQFLYSEHRAQLPASVEDQLNPRLGERAQPARVEERVSDARDALDPEGPAVRLLRALAEEPSETLRYGTLATELRRERSTIRYHVNEHLTEHDLVDRLNQHGEAAISLTSVGDAFLDTLNAEIGQQRTLSESVEGTPKSSDHAVYTTREDVPPSPSEAGWEHGLVGVEYLSRWEHHAAAGSAAAGDIALVDADIDRREDGRQGRWSYDPDRDELVVSAEFHNPLQYRVSTALALADARTFHQILDEERLAGEDDNGDGLGGLEVDDLAILRDARCLGYLKSADANPADYIEALQDAAQHLRDLTRKLRHGEYDDRDQFRSTIAREALGLESTIVHLLDLAGADVVREVRLPEFTRDYGADRREDLVTSLVKGVAIQSTYGQFAAYRQLYEDREEKRATALSPRVDAADPTGRYIGSIVVTGPGVESLEGELVDALQRPGALHDDAPEFSVPVDVATAERTEYADVIRRLFRAKYMKTTPESISLLQAFSASPYAAAEAIGRGLSTESRWRSVRPDEVRLALATLEPGQLLPDAKPSVRKVVHALLTTDEVLSQTELANRAGVSTESIRTHADRLAAFDIVRKTPDGYRFALPFQGEHGTEHGAGEGTSTDHVQIECLDESGATLHTVLQRAISRLLPEDTDLVEDPPPAAEAIHSWPPDFEALVAVWPWMDPWIDVVDILLDASRVRNPDTEPYSEAPRTVSFGAEIEQTPIGTTKPKTA